MGRGFGGVGQRGGGGWGNVADDWSVKASITTIDSILFFNL